MPTDEEFLKRILDVVKDGKDKPDLKVWSGIVIAILTALFSFWASNAVMGERVSRLQRDLEEVSKSNLEVHRRLEKVDRDTDKALDSLTRVIPEMQSQLRELWYKAKHDPNQK